MASKPEIMKMYSSKLDELTSTSKRRIDILTQLAGKYISFAEDIVEAIEIRILKKFGNSNLSLFYLIDSILKNIGQEYITHFSRNIQRYFCSTLDRADENTLPSMMILCGSWKALIAAETLEAIDSHIRGLHGHKQTGGEKKRPLEEIHNPPSKKIRREDASSNEVQPNLVAHDQVDVQLVTKGLIRPPAKQVKVNELFGQLVANGLVSPPANIIQEIFDKMVDVGLISLIEKPEAKVDIQAETQSSSDIKLIGRNRQIYEAKLRSEVAQKMLKVWDLPKDEWDKHIDAKFQLEMEVEEQEVVPSATEDFGAAVTYCGVCGDEFNHYFDDDSKEWKLHNAIRQENLYYHPICLEDI